MQSRGRKQDVGMDWWERIGCMLLGRDAVKHERNQDVGLHVVGTGFIRAWTQPGIRHGNGMRPTMDVIRM